MAYYGRNDAEPYSVLEVTPFERTGHPPPERFHQSYPRGEAYRDAAEKQAVPSFYPSSDPIYVPAHEDPRAPYPVYGAEQQDASKTERKRKRKKWIAGIVIVLLLLAGGVAGGVAGGILSKHGGGHAVVAPVSTSSSTSSSPSPPPSSSATHPSSSPAPAPSTTTTPTMSGPATAMVSYAFPTAVSWGFPHMEIFALNSSIYTEWKYRLANTTELEFQGAFEGWIPDGSVAGQSFISLGGTTHPNEISMAAVARAGTEPDITAFVWGLDKGLWVKHHNSSMIWDFSTTEWIEILLGGIMLSPPTSVSWGADRLDVFVINDDYSLLQAWQTTQDGWHVYVLVVSQYTWATDAPSVVCWGENRYDVFLVRRDDGALYHRYYDGVAWGPGSDFERLGGFCAGRPVAVSRDIGLIDVFVRGGDAGLWHISFDDSLPAPQQWSNWTSISGGTLVQAEPDAVASGANQIHVFAWGVDGSMLYKAYDARNSSWTPKKGFDIIGSGLIGPPKGVYDGVFVHVFAYLGNGELGRTSLNVTSGKWSPEGLELLGLV